MKFIIYKDRKGEYRWTLKARNGRKIADSAESYKAKWKCKKIIKSLANRVILMGAEIVDGNVTEHYYS